MCFFVGKKDTKRFFCRRKRLKKNCSAKIAKLLFDMFFFEE